MKGRYAQLSRRGQQHPDLQFSVDKINMVVVNCEIQVEMLVSKYGLSDRPGCQPSTSNS